MAKFADELRRTQLESQQRLSNVQNNRAEVEARNILKKFREQCTSAADLGKTWTQDQYWTFGWNFMNFSEKNAAYTDTLAVVNILKKELATLGFREYSVNYCEYSAGKRYIVTINAHW